VIREARIREYSRRGTKRMIKERREERKKENLIRASPSLLEFNYTVLVPLISGNLIALHVRTVRFFVST
jgi:hypothetical protein